nr:ribosomal protein L13 [Cavernulicola chilensis]
MNQNLSISDNKNVSKWYIIDAQNKILGRLSAKISKILQGKHKISYSPQENDGDFIIVINAEKVQVLGKKKYTKIYLRHSGRPGKMKRETFIELQNRIPSRIIEKSVAGMLPKNSLGRQMFKRLRVYSGVSHPHKAQIPEELNI